MTPDTCPLCGKQLLDPHGFQRAGKRICASCGGKIGRYHKWEICSDGRLRHKDCHNPTGSKNSNKEEGLF